MSSQSMPSAAVTAMFFATPSSSPSPSPIPSEAEITFYYSGISPSPPRRGLIYRTSASARPFVLPRGPEAQRRLKYAVGVHGHAQLNAVWNEKEGVGWKVRDALEDARVGWTSIDLVRFLLQDPEYDGNEDEDREEPLRVVLWIGIRPGSLSASSASLVASAILGILRKARVDDVEVEFRESLFRRGIRGPLTTAFGVGIAPVDKPDRERTIGLYFEDADRLMGLTCRHVLDTTSVEGVSVQLLGTAAFDRLLESIRLSIKGHRINVEICQRTINRTRRTLHSCDEDDVADAKRQLKKAQERMEESNEDIDALEIFYASVEKDWASAENRVIETVFHTPPIAYSHSFMRDWAAIEINASKFGNAFKGAFIALGTKFSSVDLILKLGPNFTYPPNGLLPLHGILSFPGPSFEQDERLIVLKNGYTTGLTFGCACNLVSLVRDPDTGTTSTVCAVFNGPRHLNNPGSDRTGKGDCPAFAAPGDSGSAVVDAQGRILGILVGCAASDDKADVSYVLPMEQVWEDVKSVFPNARLSMNIST
ncbi:hypothetical protein CYLTODRAFT_447344 [Cylindrobasidium torrendii FP15055 ss-10]|uniref:Peptidase S1 domain-containing protein n=1 Tax=Cylindrobasidium torrendii FP15055 ss-10 TaxID=1314674 RepID=A0A0D7AV07_9AGAR|nr:hypothetical protein CYLTODRAFT_447344 [Cylindrobasidium torrendii FP15055 ss-10]